MISRRTQHLLGLLLIVGSVCACASDPPLPHSDSTPVENSATVSPEPPAPLGDEPGRVPRLLKDGAGPVPTDLEQLAKMFIEYAAGQRKSLPMAKVVSVTLGGAVVSPIDRPARGPATRRAWQVCPAEDYSDTSCPVDLLGPVEEAAVNGNALAYSTSFESVVCAPKRSGPVPRGHVVVIRPSRESRTCSGDFALALVGDAQGRLLRLDLTLSNP